MDAREWKMVDLTIDFSQEGELAAIKGKVLPFLKDRSITDGDTVHCTIHQGKVDSPVNERFPFWAGNTVQTMADTIAEFLVGYAEGKDDSLYSSATISVQ